MTRVRNSIGTTPVSINDIGVMDVVLLGPNDSWPLRISKVTQDRYGDVKLTFTDGTDWVQSVGGVIWRVE